MPARPLQMGGATPAGEIPVTGGSLFGKIANMPQEMMSAPGGMFGGKGTAGSPTAPAPQAPPQQIQMGGGQQAQPIFGQASGGGQPGSGPDIWSMLQQLLQTQQPLQPGGM